MHVLLVEDEAKLARAVSHVLTSEGFQVECVYDGDAGLERALHDRYDLVILDWMLPRRDGIDVLREVRRQGVRVPILFLTAKDAVSDRVMGLDLGADDYLVKPFAAEELLARTRAVIRRFQRTLTDDAEILRQGSLAVNLTSHEATVDGEQVELTHKEFQLLVLLMQHPRQVLSKEIILDRVWGYDSSAVPNAVEIYVHYLRKKLRSAGRMIKTVRGVGYRLEV